MSEGPKLVNFLPKDARGFIGDLAEFKIILDSWLQTLSDITRSSNEEPPITNIEGFPGNRIQDWVRASMT